MGNKPSNNANTSSPSSYDDDDDERTRTSLRYSVMTPDKLLYNLSFGVKPQAVSSAKKKDDPSSEQTTSTQQDSSLVLFTPPTKRDSTSLRSKKLKPCVSMDVPSPPPPKKSIRQRAKSVNAVQKRSSAPTPLKTTAKGKAEAEAEAAANGKGTQGRRRNTVATTTASTSSDATNKKKERSASAITTAPINSSTKSSRLITNDVFPNHQQEPSEPSTPETSQEDSLSSSSSYDEHQSTPRKSKKEEGVRIKKIYDGGGGGDATPADETSSAKEKDNDDNNNNNNKKEIPPFNWRQHSIGFSVEEDKKKKKKKKKRRSSKKQKSKKIIALDDDDEEEEEEATSKEEGNDTTTNKTNNEVVNNKEEVAEPTTKQQSTIAESECLATNRSKKESDASEQQRQQRDASEQQQQQQQQQEDKEQDDPKQTVEPTMEDLKQNQETDSREKREEKEPTEAEQLVQQARPDFLDPVEKETHLDEAEDVDDLKENEEEKNMGGSSSRRRESKRRGIGWLFGKKKENEDLIRTTLTEEGVDMSESEIDDEESLHPFDAVIADNPFDRNNGLLYPFRDNNNSLNAEALCSSAKDERKANTEHAIEEQLLSLCGGIEEDEEDEEDDLFLIQGTIPSPTPAADPVEPTPALPQPTAMVQPTPDPPQPAPAPAQPAPPPPATRKRMSLFSRKTPPQSSALALPSEKPAADEERRKHLRRVSSLMKFPSLGERNRLNYEAVNVKKVLKAAPPSKWKLETTRFEGRFDCCKMGRWEEVRGKSIDKGLKKFKANPDKYAGLIYQHSHRFYSASQCVYTLIHREGTASIHPLEEDPKGAFVIMLQHYLQLERLPEDELPLENRDPHTWDVALDGEILHNPDRKPILPGRGMGVGDLPNLKIIGDVDPSDIEQGDVGDCWLLTAMSTLAEFDGAVKRLFRKTEHLDCLPSDKPSQITVTLYDLETWKEVDIVIDESLCAHPTRKGELLGAQVTEDGELWVAYLEKAFLAHVGRGWDGLDGGHCTLGWAMMTGCKEQYYIRKNNKTKKYCCAAKYDAKKQEWKQHYNFPRHENTPKLEYVAWPEVGGGGDVGLEITADELFMKMYAWDLQNYIVGAGAKNGIEGENVAENGLVRNHSYGVISSHHHVAGTTIDLLKLRNPWGRGEIQDTQFGDTGPGWDQYPEIKAELKPVVADDGIFYLTKEEFFDLFDHIYLSASDMTKFKED